MEREECCQKFLANFHKIHIYILPFSFPASFILNVRIARIPRENNATAMSGACLEKVPPRGSEMWPPSASS